MNELITRKIDPRIKMANKVIFILSLLLILGIDLEYMKVVFFLSIGITGLYELYIYKTNEVFIELIEKDKNHFTYKLMMKYYKLGLWMFLCLLPNFLYMIGSNYYTLLKYQGVYLLDKFDFLAIIIALLIYFGLIEIFIINKNSFKVIVKYAFLLLLLLFFEYNHYFIDVDEVLIQFVKIAVYFQILYLLFNFTIWRSYKKLIKKPTYLNYDLIISLVLILIYEVIVFTVWKYISLTTISIVLYFIFLIAILGLNDSLKKRYKVKETKYSKFVKYYFVGLVFIFSFVFLILRPNMIINLTEQGYIIKFMFNNFIRNFIIIGIINILIFELYILKRKFFKNELEEKVSEIYDNWY